MMLKLYKLRQFLICGGILCKCLDPENKIDLQQIDYLTMKGDECRQLISEITVH